MKALALIAFIFLSVAFAIWAAFAFVTLDPRWLITAPPGSRFWFLVVSAAVTIPLSLTFLKW